MCWSWWASRAARSRRQPRCRLQTWTCADGTGCGSRAAWSRSPAGGAPPSATGCRCLFLPPCRRPCCGRERASWAEPCQHARAQRSGERARAKTRTLSQTRAAWAGPRGSPAPAPPHRPSGTPCAARRPPACARRGSYSPSLSRTGAQCCRRATSPSSTRRPPPASARPSGGAPPPQRAWRRPAPPCE